MRLKPSCCVSALELNKKPSSHTRILSLSLSARNTRPCLGQVLTLFRAEASQIAYPVQDSETKKPYPSSSTSPYSPNEGVPLPGSGVPRNVVITCKLHKYIASSPVRSFNNLNHLVECRFRLLFGTKSLYFGKKNAMSLICPVISSPIVYVWSGTRRIVRARSSLMASSLSLVCVLCSTLTISSFPLEIEKNIRP